MSFWSMKKSTFPLSETYRIKEVGEEGVRISVSRADGHLDPMTYIVIENGGLRADVFLDNRAVKLMIKALQESIK